MRPSASPESLVDDRVEQLKAISQRRNVLLREMYHLMRRRQNVGFILTFDEGEEEDLPEFLDRFDLQKNPETGTVAHLLDSEMFAFDSSRRPAQSDFRTRSRSMAKTNATEIKPSIFESVAERRASLRRDVRKTEWRNKSRVVKDFDDESFDFHAVSQRSFKSGDEGESDDILALEPPEGQPSRHHSASLPPHHYQDDDDDDERDELDLIGSISPSPRSGTSYEPRTRDSHYQEEAEEDGDIPHDKIPIADEQEFAEPEEAQIEIMEEPRILTPPLTAPQEQVVSKNELTELPAEVTMPEVEQMDTAEDNEVVDGQSMPMPPIELHMHQEEPTALKEEDDVLQAELQPVMQDIVMEIVDDQTKPEQTVNPSEGQHLAIECDTPVAKVVYSPRPYLPDLPALPAPSIRLVLMPAPSSPLPNLPLYNFDVGPEPASPQPASCAETRHHFNPQYTLPPLKSLPLEFNRRGKLAKQQRKREKERERNGCPDKSEGKKEYKDDWVPMGLNRWSANLRANPLWTKVNRASKCLSTRDWSVAMTELRLVRTLDRVELLKDEGRWSFRQPKKQRGVGGLTKTHWDYLMDEMKWMRIDFREERKWKMVLAYNLSTAVLEWHAAGTPAERVHKGICVLWKPPQIAELHENPADTVEDHMDIDPLPQTKKPNPLSIVDYGSDDEDEDDEADKDQSVVDALEPTVVVQDALEYVDHDRDQPRDNAVEVMEPKKEDMDDSSALQSVNVEGDGSSRDAPQDAAPEDANVFKAEEASVGPAISLKSTSMDPFLGYSSQSMIDSEPTSSSYSKPSSKSKIYAPLRESIAYSDERKLFLDLDDLHQFQALSFEDNAVEALPPPPDLSIIFPDLLPLSLLDVAPPLAPSSLMEGKKKSEKRSEKDDPNKRAEDTTYTKLAPLGRFMYCKPTLLGPLQPSKRWKNGGWCTLDEIPVTSEIDGPSAKAEEGACELFEGNKPGNSPSVYIPILPGQPKESRKRIEHLWTERDDLLLKATVEKYPNNWPLICDIFNSSRVTISTDKRTPWDCLERWKVRWESVLEEVLPPAPAQMTTRGVKRLASASLTGLGAGGSPSGSGGDSKKRRRHFLMLETIRKTSKKREQEKKSSSNQRKPSAIHDTHGQYNKMPKLTPAELSRMKADKEQRDDQELLLAKRRHEELSRQQLLREQTHRMQVAPNIQQAQILQQQQQQQQQVNGPARPAGIGISAAQGVPQIRSQVNISQQQRIPTPMSAANTRLSPQQIMQVQAQAAQRALAAQGQGQATNINGVGTHMSPPYISRAATSSPAQSSPPRNAGTPSNASNPPRPPSAQPQTGMAPIPQVPGNAIPRPSNISHFFPVSNMQSAQYTPEQMEQALRLQNLLQAQRQAGISQGSQNGSYSSQS